MLEAKQAGYEQWLRADVGGRRVRGGVHTVDPFQPGELPPRRDDQPVEVAILSDQGAAVAFPVGARFDDFRIEARYADGFTRMVTKKATMTTDAGFTDADVLAIVQAVGYYAYVNRVADGLGVALEAE